MESQHKQEFPPLLDSGLSVMKLGALRTLCVQRFQTSKTRKEIMDGLERFIQKVLSLGIDDAVLWVDGSFLTNKEDPEDSDVLLIVPSRYLDSGTAEQVEFLEALDDRNKKLRFREEYRCDTHSVLLYPASSTLRVLSDAIIAGFLEDFGHSFVTREPKGIAALDIQQPQNIEAEGAGA